MDSNTLDALDKAFEPELCRLLKNFNTMNAKTMIFPEFKENVSNKQRLVNILMRCVVDENYRHIYSTILETVRILVRDKHRLDILVTESNLRTISHLAGYNDNGTILRDIEYSQHDTDNTTQHDENYYEAVVEAQKCLCNLFLNSAKAREFCCSNGTVEGIVKRVRDFSNELLPYDVKFFDLRLLFLLTALCRQLRNRVSMDLHGLVYLMDVLDVMSTSSKRGSVSDSIASTSTDTTLLESSTSGSAVTISAALPEKEVDLSCEILKVLFNLVSDIDKKIIDEEVEGELRRLVSICHDLLLCKVENVDKQEELRSHSVNLLTSVPHSCYEGLLTPMDDTSLHSSCLATNDSIRDMEFEGKNMQAVTVLLRFLELRIDKAEKALIQSKELLIPVLSVMCDSSKVNRNIRKYLRPKVLPPLRDVMSLPEEGNAIRNKLCRLMTHPVTEVKDLAAEFLFILCKENVERFVKYTGYGNAAGLLVQKGLMLGRRLGSHPPVDSRYSSASEDSDTEEYEQHKDSIDPMTGRVKEVHEDPMAGMTDEQKEYEARKLMEQIERLQRRGIQPLRIDDDGRANPVEHVMELLESHNADENTGGGGTESDSD